MCPVFDCGLGFWKSLCMRKNDRRMGLVMLWYGIYTVCVGGLAAVLVSEVCVVRVYERRNSVSGLW